MDPMGFPEECFDMLCEPNWFDVDGQIQYLWQQFFWALRIVQNFTSPAFVEMYLKQLCRNSCAFFPEGFMMQTEVSQCIDS